MSKKFLHIPDMVTTGEYDIRRLSQQDFEKIGAYLPYFLANIRQRSTLDKFLEKFPQTEDWLAEPDNYRRCISLVSGADAPLLQYLTEKKPLNEEETRLISKAKHKPLKPIFTRLPVYLVDQQKDVEKIAGSLRILSRNQIEWALIQPEDNLLEKFLRTRAFDEFKEFFPCLSPANQQLILDQISNSEHSGIIESPDTLHVLIQAAGAEQVRQAYLKTLIPERIRQVQEMKTTDEEYRKACLEIVMRELPNSLGRGQGSLLTRACTLLDHHAGILDDNYKPFLEIFTPQERIAIIREDNFHLISRTIMLDNPDGFRMLYDMMEPDQRIVMFKNPSVLREVCFHAATHNDLSFFEQLEDILPPHILYYAQTNFRPPDIMMPPGLDRLTDTNDSEPQKLIFEHHDKQKLYDDLFPLIKTASQVENGGVADADDIIHKRVTKLAGLFDNLKSVDRYLATTRKGYGGGAPKQPVHDACLFTLPEEPFDRQRWSRLVITFGPAVSKFLPLAAKIDEYAKYNGLPLPKTPREIVDIASYVTYKRFEERVALASTCLGSGVPESQFNRILDLLNGTLEGEDGAPITLKTKSNIPSITIDGADIGHPGYIMTKLNVTQEAEDKIAELVKKGELSDREVATVLGELSHCCQSIGKAGEKFVLHGMTSDKGDFYVWKKRVRNKPDKVIAQSWVWLADDKDNPSTLVFDSIEPLGTAHNQIFADFMLEFDKRAKSHGIHQINIGKGGNTPTNLSFEDAKKPARLSAINFHTTGATFDSESQYTVRTTNHSPDSPSRS